MFGTYQRLGLPVWASDIEVIRAAYTRIRPRARRGKATRRQRHNFYRAMIAEHAKAAKLYYDVMRGNI